MAARMERKTAQLAVVRARGERFARAHPDETDPVGFLERLGPLELNAKELASRRNVLPATWQGAFAQDWRTSRELMSKARNSR